MSVSRVWAQQNFLSHETSVPSVQNFLGAFTFFSKLPIGKDWLRRNHFPKKSILKTNCLEPLTSFVEGVESSLPVYYPSFICSCTLFCYSNCDCVQLKQNILFLISDALNFTLLVLPADETTKHLLYLLNFFTNMATILRWSSEDYMNFRK